MSERKKILVTGGAGFIGSHTVVALHEMGFEAILVDNFSNSQEDVLEGISKITGINHRIYKADCNDQNAMRGVFQTEGDINGVIHFAAYKAVGESVEKPLAYYRNNVSSLITLMELMDEFKVRNLVFSSSCTVYGEPDTLPVTEEFPSVVANSPYGNTKQICEEIIQDSIRSNSYDISAVLLRYFNPIGAHPSGNIGELPLGVPNNLVPFITQCAYGLREKITVFGSDYSTNDGTCVRDYIHVLDLAEAHVHALDWLNKEEQGCEILNLGTGTGSSVLEVIQGFEKVNNLKLNYEIGERRAGDVEAIYADGRKAEEKLNWKCRFDLEDALRDAWNWERKHRDSLK